MIETVLVMPFIMIALMLIVYLGWNFRRIAQVTNMDRYAVWEEVTPGSTGPNMQGLDNDMRNPKLNQAFYGLNSDQAIELDELQGGSNRYLPEGHRQLRDQQTDEAYSYFEEFLDQNPRGIQQRFTSKHSQSVNTQVLDLSDFASNGQGHSRMDGDWRYAREIYQHIDGQWKYGTSERDRSDDDPRLRDEDPRRRIIDGDPRDGKPLSYYHVSASISLREIFFIEMHDGLESIASNGNRYASGVRRFYLAHPEYKGPEIDPDDDTDGRSGGGVGVLGF